MLDVFRSRPFLIEKIWGGQKIKTKYGKYSAYSRVGESWEVADLPEGQSIVDSGPFKDSTLAEMVQKFGKELIGTQTHHSRFPLLVKILDAKENLSVQVHPGPEDLHLFDNAYSKDECWIFLDCENNSKIAHGFNTHDSNSNSFYQWIEKNQIEKNLQYISVKKSQAIRVPPKTVHAICGGTSLLEIQEPSDTTFRIYDYQREDSDGKRRPLHIQDAIKVIDFQTHSKLEEVSPLSHSILFDAPNYRVEVLNVKNAKWEISPRSPQVLFNMGPSSVMLSGVKLLPYQSAIIPACVAHVGLTSSSTNRIYLAGTCGPLVNKLSF